FLREGENAILVRLTTGVERVEQQEAIKYHAATEEKKRPGRGDRRRVFLRKPQYNYGWDWAPRVATCCINGSVRIEAYRRAAIRDVKILAEMMGKQAKLDFTVEIENFDPMATIGCEIMAEIALPERETGETGGKTGDGSVSHKKETGDGSVSRSGDSGRAELRDSGHTEPGNLEHSEIGHPEHSTLGHLGHRTVPCLEGVAVGQDTEPSPVLSASPGLVSRGSVGCVLRSGVNFVKLSAIIDDAQLWWPNGMGEQPLYEIRVSAEVMPGNGEAGEAEKSDTGQNPAEVMPGSDKVQKQVQSTGVIYLQQPQPHSQPHSQQQQSRRTQDTEPSPVLPQQQSQQQSQQSRRTQDTEPSPVLPQQQRQSYIITYPAFKYGIRSIRIDQSEAANKGERLFAVTVNGVRAFCKGANWIPADSLYARVTDGKYTCLIREAAEAGFNMLRIWGGGLYERDIFYDMCDRYGILVWHDMMFGCAEYPDDCPWFMSEVEKEIDYQTKRLRNHPSIALWCGNNENQMFYYKRKSAPGKAGYFGAKIYDSIAPAYVEKNCPQIPYWNSSPYGGNDPNSKEVGDRHHWGDCMMNPDMMKRIRPEEYDKACAKFVSEYGYVGPLKKQSVLKYLDGAPFEIQGKVWQHHNNTFEKDTVLAGIAHHYGDVIFESGSTDKAQNSCAAANAGDRRIDINKYLLYAGLCQGLMYNYSLEAFRTWPECSGGLFWMYNDCWGETGWTIIDYYLVRKISYYFVKRALAHVKLILREAKCEACGEAGGEAVSETVSETGGEVSSEVGSDDKGLNSNDPVEITAINEAPQKTELDIEFGYVSFDGSVRDSEVIKATLEPHSRKVIHTFEQKGHDPVKGLFFARVCGEEGESGKVPLAVLRKVTYREFEMTGAAGAGGTAGKNSDVAGALPSGCLSVTKIEKSPDGKSFVTVIKSNAYAHAVHFRLPDEIKLSDEYFDMLPGDERKVAVYGKYDLFASDFRAYCVHLAEHD
ncbi:MAG: hypothetical protein PHG48_04120, partial [Eubacteriales bacterium]|nr:hypothetical protein [Eubacteriales bacterium]